MLQYIKQIVKSNPLGALAYGKYIMYLKWKRKRALQKNGYEVVKEFDALVSSYGYDYFADFGTLLGFMREQGFLSHDDDIDFSIRATEVDFKLLQILLSHGYKFYRAFELNGRLTELSFYRRGVSIDIFFYFDRPNGMCYYDYVPDVKLPPGDSRWLARKMDRPSIAKTIPLVVHGIGTRIVENWDEMLTAHYGNWRVPDPSWNYVNRTSIDELNEHGTIVGLDRTIFLLRKS